MSTYLRGMENLSVQTTLSKHFLLPFWKMVYSERIEFAPFGSKFYPFGVDLIFEEACAG